MRRSLAAVGGTVVGLVGLLHYKSGPPPTRLATGPGGSSGGTPIPTSPTTPTTAGSPSLLTPPSSAPGGEAVVPTTTPTAPGHNADGTFTGAVVNTRYGPVEVRVTISGGQIVDVTAVERPCDRARSAAISDAAAPILRREALAAQGASIDTVSGATYTSEGYARSLQAALDAARR
jgi:uncharacterized protein with FMN-binding domain